MRVEGGEKNSARLFLNECYKLVTSVSWKGQNRVSHIYQRLKPCFSEFKVTENGSASRVFRRGNENKTASMESKKKSKKKRSLLYAPLK